MSDEQEPTYHEKLVNTSCGVCGVRFGLPVTHFNTLKKNGVDFSCPNSHKISFKPVKEMQDNETIGQLRTENARLCAKIDQLEAQLEGLKSKE
jgi:hypothetical protein